MESTETEVLGPRAGSFAFGRREPSVNVDKIDVEAGMQMARDLAYTDELEQMLVSYALIRWARGEEEQAEKMVTDGVDGVRIGYMNWRMILAAACAAA